MAQAKRDQNRVTVMLGVSSVDGTTPLPIRVDPVTGYIMVAVQEVVAAGSPSTLNRSLRDADRDTTVIGVSSTDSTTIEATRTHNDYLAVDLAT